MPNITTLYFDRFKHNSAFNKGGALRFAQEYVYSKYYKNANASILILDSDIALPNNFKHVISGFNPENNTIYGVIKRTDYHSLQDFIKGINGVKHSEGQDVIGFFQLYKFSTNYYRYNESHNCGWTDSDFRDMFPHRGRLELSVSHLGRDSINWLGRDKTKDDIFSKCHSPNCQYLMNTDISKKKYIGPYCCVMCKKGEKDHGGWCQRKKI